MSRQQSQSFWEDTSWEYIIKFAPILTFISICVLTPISEELLFRGYMLDALNRLHGKWPAIIISSIIFGLVHFDPFTIGMAAIGGVIYGWIRIRTGSLVPGIVAHAMWNTMALMVTCLPLVSLGSAHHSWCLECTPVRFLITCDISRRRHHILTWRITQLFRTGHRKSSFLTLSLCMLHSPHEGQGGSPFSLGVTFVCRLKIFLYLFGRHQPFDGLLIFGSPWLH